MTAEKESEPSSGHETLPHTADVGIMAWSDDLPGLFREAACALGDQIADVHPGSAPVAWITVRVQGSDLAGLAFAWLNALITEAEITRGALVESRVDRVARRDNGTWVIEARAGLAPFDGTAIRVRRPPKSATYHDLVVEPRGSGWLLRAYLDV